jgi:hypothetical protein
MLHIWFDGQWARMQKSIDVASPDTVNVLQHEDARWLVAAYSDCNPGKAFLLDEKTL